MENFFNYPLYILFGVLPSLLWLHFYLRRDVKPEPRLMILKVFALGVLSTIPAIFLEIAFFKEIKAFAFSSPVLLIFNVFLGVALVEEAVKFLAVKFGVLNNPEFDEPIDAMIYMIIAALGFAAGELAEHLGLHFIIGAYFAGLFFEEKVVNERLFHLVNDRLYGLSYSFLGPIFFISLGFNITFDLQNQAIWFLVALTLAVIIGQILSAGLMARLRHFTWIESLTIGVGHCARAEMAFIIASLGIEMGVLDKNIFSVLVFTAFLLNLATPLMLKGCATLLNKYQAHWSY